MKSPAAVLGLVLFALTGLPGCGWQDMSKQEKIGTVSRILKVFRPSRSHTYDPALEDRIRRNYSPLHFKFMRAPEQHNALIEAVLREHTLPLD